MLGCMSTACVILLLFFILYYYLIIFTVESVLVEVVEVQQPSPVAAW